MVGVVLPSAAAGMAAVFGWRRPEALPSPVDGVAGGGVLAGVGDAGEVRGLPAA